MGFWSSLAAIGSVVAAPFTGGTSLAFLPAALGGASIGIGMLEGRGKGGKGGGGGGDMSMSPAEQKMMESLGLAVDDAGQYVPKFMDRSNQAGQSAQDYYTGVLEGSPGQRAEFMAPELEGMQRNYQTAISDTERFGPRGGERDRSLTMARLGRAGDTSRIMSQARPRAADALASLSSSQGAIGLGANQQRISGASAGLTASNQRRAINTNNRQIDSNNQGSMWDTIGGLIEGGIDAFGKKKKKAATNAPELTPEVYATY